MATLSEIASLICNFSFYKAVDKDASADPSLGYTLHDVWDVSHPPPLPQKKKKKRKKKKANKHPTTYEKKETKRTKTSKNMLITNFLRM